MRGGDLKVIIRKKKSRKTDPEMTQMIELVDKAIRALMINIFLMLKIEESLSGVSRIIDFFS